MNNVSGLGKIERGRLSEVIRGTKGTITVVEAARILDLTRPSAAKILARWASKGWVSRVRRGLYVSVPLASRTGDVSLEDPWIIADRVYTPCYIGGWSAAEYWGLTEQIFRTVVVMTKRKPSNRTPVMKGTNFLVRTVSERALFGLKAVWRSQVKISVSDPTRTIIDLLNDPRLAGGLRPTVDMFNAYMQSDNKSEDLLIEYAERLGNGAVFKRLGFLTERFVPDAENVISSCATRLTKGNAKLDPTLSAARLVTRWRLLVPENWADGGQRD